MTQPCPFCEIVAGRAPATTVREWADTLAIVPLNPVVAGHLLVVPKEHVTDFVDDPVVSAQTMYRAAELCDDFGSYNVITSRGRWATQSVFHLHLHIVPRKDNDGLALPWYSGRSKRKPVLAVEEEPQFGVEGCTCKPWTRQTDPPRYLDQPGDTVDMIGGWEIGDCPHHKRRTVPAVGEQPHA